MKSDMMALGAGLIRAAVKAGEDVSALAAKAQPEADASASASASAGANTC